jgi:hypothetical protein
VFTHLTRVLGLCLLAMAVLCCLSFFAGASEVAVDCTKLTRWTKRPKPPQVNQAHVFCGEWKQNAPGGFHSRPGGLDPDSVTRFTISSRQTPRGFMVDPGATRVIHDHRNSPPCFQTRVQCRKS